MKLIIGGRAGIPLWLAYCIVSGVAGWKRKGHGILPAILLAFGFAQAIAAQEYSFRSYGAAEGLQNLVVLSLAQDRAGYIWVGTEGGLYRYDGARFRLIGLAEGLPCSTEVHGLFLAADGALWVNTCDGIFRYDGQRFEANRVSTRCARRANDDGRCRRRRLDHHADRPLQTYRGA